MNKQLAFKRVGDRQNEERWRELDLKYAGQRDQVHSNRDSFTTLHLPAEADCPMRGATPLLVTWPCAQLPRTSNSQSTLHAGQLGCGDDPVELCVDDSSIPQMKAAGEGCRLLTLRMSAFRIAFRITCSDSVHSEYVRHAYS